MRNILKSGACIAVAITALAAVPGLANAQEQESAQRLLPDDSSTPDVGKSDQDQYGPDDSDASAAQGDGPGPEGEGPGPDGGGPPMGGNQFVIGVGGAYQPGYLGSDDYRFQPLPMVDIKQGRFFANFQDGIGANLIDSDSVTIGAGFTMADNYRSKDVPDGIGKLKMGLGARGFVKLRQAGFEAVLGGTKIVTGGTEGIVADASLSYPIFVSPSFMLMPSVGGRWADRKHNNRYFGINAQQSTASGLPQFSTGSGLLDAKAELGAMFRLTDRINLGVIGGVSTLLGNVKNSPIVEKKTSPFGIFFIGYSF